MTQEHLKNIIEAALMAYDEPRNVNQLLALFDEDEEKPEKDTVREALAQLAEDYEGRGIELKEVASGFRIQVRADYAFWVGRLFQERPQRYSRAFMETLAIIAYRQPVTRSEIEDIRGVSVNANIIKQLQEREWIRVVGHRDVPGKPELLATSREFLDYFNLKKLSDLPPLSEIKDYDEINPDLFEGLEGIVEAAAAAGAGTAQTEGEEADAGDNPTEDDVVETADAAMMEDDPEDELEDEDLDDLMDDDFDDEEADEPADEDDVDQDADEEASSDEADEEEPPAGDNVVPFSG